eukprot:1394929-Amorphochlora_amoeboformis.AAC.2
MDMFQQAITWIIPYPNAYTATLKKNSTQRWHSLLYLSLSFASKTVPRLTRLSSPPIFYRPKQTPLQSKNRILHGVRSMSVRADGGERGPRGAEGREIEGVCAIMVRVSGVPGGSAEEFCDELIEQVWYVCV